MTPLTPIVWSGCYESGWKGVITPESFAHPAKFSRSLIERIFTHCLDRGYLKKGDSVGDCFGGIGTGGIMASYAGLEWIGCELEPRFHKMAEDNFALHQAAWTTMKLPWPRIIQGDSRHFDVLLGEDYDAMVSSPPFATEQTGGGLAKAGTIYVPSNGQAESGPTHFGKFGKNHGYQNQGETEGQISQLKSGSVDSVISSPPYADTTAGNDACGIDWQKAAPTKKTSGRHQAPGKSASTEYGKSDGQIGTLKSGSVAAVISSPPYSDIAAGAGGLNTKPAQHDGQQSGRAPESASQSGNWSKDLLRYGKADGQISRLKPGSVEAVVSSPPFRDARSDTTKSTPTKHGGFCESTHHTTQAGAGYGEAKGQIDNLPTGDVDAVVTSPPYEATNQDYKSGWSYISPHIAKTSHNRLSAQREASYGESPGQIGKDSGETYWQAMDAVYRACHRAIKPGGIIALVVKDYVKDKQRVPLCGDTARLLEHIGFVVIERIHAMLVQETIHGDLFTGQTITKKERKSFFRRLAEKKGSPKIDFEEVIIARRP